MKAQELRKLIREEIKSNLKEGFATTEGRKLDRISEWLGYDDFIEFIGDNPGCFEVILQWIEEYFEEQLIEERISVDELEKMGLYNVADLAKKEYDKEDL